MFVYDTIGSSISDSACASVIGNCTELLNIASSHQLCGIFFEKQIVVATVLGLGAQLTHDRATVSDSRYKFGSLKVHATVSSFGLFAACIQMTCISRSSGALSSTRVTANPCPLSVIRIYRTFKSSSSWRDSFYFVTSTRPGWNAMSLSSGCVAGITSVR